MCLFCLWICYHSPHPDASVRGPHLPRIPHHELSFTRDRRNSRFHKTHVKPDSITTCSQITCTWCTDTHNHHHLPPFLYLLWHFDLPGATGKSLAKLWALRTAGCLRLGRLGRGGYLCEWCFLSLSFLRPPWGSHRLPRHPTSRTAAGHQLPGLFSASRETPSSVLPGRPLE